MLSHIQVRKQILQRYIHSSTRLVKRFNIRTKLAIQLQHWLYWNINRHQYIAHHNNYLCTIIALTVTNLMVWNAGAFYLQPSSMSIITIWAPTKLKPQYIYKQSTSDDLLLGLIPLAVHHRINHKYPKLLSIPILNMAYNKIYIPRSTVFNMLKPIEIENSEISRVLWMKIEKLNEKKLWIAQKYYITTHILTMIFHIYHYSQALSLN